jgi:hypothetical protein
MVFSWNFNRKNIQILYAIDNNNKLISVLKIYYLIKYRRSRKKLHKYE